MELLKASGAKFRINKEAWHTLETWELKNIYVSLSEWIDYNEENMTEKQFNQAMKIKEELEAFINSKEEV